MLATVSPSGWDPLAVLPEHPGIQPALASLGVGLERDVAVQVLRDRLVVAPGRLARRVFQLVRAERAGVDRLVIVHEVPREAQWELVELADIPRPEVVELEPAASGPRASCSPAPAWTRLWRRGSSPSCTSSW